MYSHVWINGVSTLQNDIYSGNCEVYATGPFTRHKVITRNLYLDNSDKLTLINATFDDGTIYVRDNAELIMSYNVTFYNLFATDNAYVKINNKVIQQNGKTIILSDSAKLVANATTNPTTLASILAYNTSRIWLKNVSVTTTPSYVAIADNVELYLLDATQVQITYLYSLPLYNSSGILFLDFTRSINAKIYSEDYTRRYIIINEAYLYGTHVELYDAQISELDLDSCPYAYFDNVSVSTLYAGILTMYEDSTELSMYYYTPSFNTSAIFRNSTISAAKAYSVTPVEFINSTITNLYYAYVVDDNNKLNISYDMNQTEIITSGAGYVAYVNTTSTITSKQLRALIAKDNGQISFSRVVLGGTTTDSISVIRSRSNLSSYWSSYGKTHYNETFYMTKTGVSDITVTITTLSWPEESIQNVTIEVLDYAGSWHTIYKMVDTSGSLSSLSLSYDNITEIIDSLAYGLRVWVIINDTNTGTIESDKVQITAYHSIDYTLDYLVSMDTAAIYATKSYLDRSSGYIRIYGLDNSHIRINESTYIGDYAYLYMLENSEFYANNTLTDMTYPFLENTTARGVHRLYTFEEASATLIKTKQSSTLYYRAYHSSSLSIYNSDLPSTYLYMYPEGNSIHLTVHNSVFRSLDSPSPSDYDGDIIADIVQSNFSYIYIYNPGTYRFIDCIARTSASYGFYVEHENATVTIENLTGEVPTDQVTVTMTGYDYTVEDVKDVVIAKNEQLYEGNVHITGSNDKLYIYTLVLSNVGAFYHINVSIGSVTYNQLAQTISISNVTAICNNTAHGTLDDTEAITHVVSLYSSGALTPLLTANLSWSGTYWYTTIDVSSVPTGSYYLVAYFTDSDAVGQSSSVNVTVQHYISVTSAEVEYDDNLGVLRVINITAVSSYAPIGVIDSSEAIVAKYSIISESDNSTVYEGNLTWTGSEWTTGSVEVISLPAGDYHVEIYFRDAMGEGSATSDKFTVGMAVMIMGSRIPILHLVLAIVAIGAAAIIPTVALIMKMRKMQK